mgnify:CR=1 FL=1
MLAAMDNGTVKIDVVGPAASKEYTFIAHASGCCCAIRQRAMYSANGAELLTVSVTDRDDLSVQAWGLSAHDADNANPADNYPVHLAPYCKKLLLIS